MTPAAPPIGHTPLFLPLAVRNTLTLCSSGHQSHSSPTNPSAAPTQHARTTTPIPAVQPSHGPRHAKTPTRTLSQPVQNT